MDFKPLFGALYIRVFALGATGGAVVVVLTVLSEIDFAAFLLIPLTAALAAVPVTWLCMHYGTVRLTPEGLQARDTWCRLRTVRWTGAASMRGYSFLGLRYLVVRAADQPGSVWIPMFLSDMSKFKAAVEKAAGAASTWTSAIAKASA